MSTSTSVVVSSCEYWMRIAISLHLCVKNALLDILHDPNINGLPRNEQQLFQKLHQFKQNQQKVLKNVIKQFQWEKMCHCCSASCLNPCSRQGKTKAEDLDITCIVILIIHLTKLPPPQGGWKKNKPNPNDTTEAAFVLLARQLRNDLNHCAVQDIFTEQEFNDYWHTVESILLGLQFGDMKLFHDLKTIPLDVNTDLKITGLTGQMNLRITSLADQMSDLRDDMETQKSDKDVAQLDRIIDGIKKQLTRLETEKLASKSQLKTLQDKLNSFEESLKKRMKNAESTISQHEERISQVEETARILQVTTPKSENGLSSFDKKFQELSNANEAVKVNLDEIDTRIVNLVGNIPQMISNASDNTERKLKEKVEERLKTHQKGLDPKEILLPECLDIISKNIGKDWKRLSVLLHLPTEGTLEQEQPHLNMNKCFENAQNLISWKTMKGWLKNLKRDDLVKKLQNETNLTDGISNSIKRHRQRIFKDYEKVNAIDPFMKKTTGATPVQRLREDVFVDLTVVSQQKYIKEYSECDNFIAKMAEDKRSITLDELVKTGDRFVLVTGNAGIGKSQMIDTVTLKWAKGELLNGKNGAPIIEFLFPIKCRELNTINFTSDSFQSIFQRLFPEVFNEITINDLQDISHKIMFVIDGLDEMMSIEQLNHPASIQNARVQQMVQFVHDVLVSNAKVFPNQYAVAVGRPYISSFLKSPAKCVYVCGFSKVSVNHYIERNCDDNVRGKVTTELELSQNLAAMSHVPVYLSVICDIYKEDVAIETPRTTTELMMYACLVFIRRHLVDYEKDVKYLPLTKLCDRVDVMRLIKSICWMSFDSLIHKRVLFENDDLGEIILDVEELEKKTGFIVKSSNGEKGDLYQFSHLVLHELFCGLHMYFSSDIEFSVAKDGLGQATLAPATFNSNVEGDFQSCYPIAACIEGTLQARTQSNSILFKFLKRLGGTYNNSEGKPLMQKLHQGVVDAQKAPYKNMMYLRCCFESNSDVPANVANCVLDCTSDRNEYLFISSLLELRWLYHFFEKIKFQDIRLKYIRIDFGNKNLHKDDVESLAYLLQFVRSHWFINGCSQVYKKLVTYLQSNNSKLKEVSVKKVYDEGLWIVLPYLISLTIEHIGQSIQNVNESISHLHEKVKVFSKAGRLNLRTLEIRHFNMKERPIGYPFSKLIDCIKYIQTVQLQYFTTVDREVAEEIIYDVSIEIDQWITTNDISIDEIFGEFRIRISVDKHDDYLIPIRDDFNKKYRGKSVLTLL